MNWQTRVTYHTFLVLLCSSGVTLLHTPTVKKRWTGLSACSLQLWNSDPSSSSSSNPPLFSVTFCSLHVRNTGLVLLGRGCWAAGRPTSINRWITACLIASARLNIPFLWIPWMEYVELTREATSAFWRLEMKQDWAFGEIHHHATFLMFPLIRWIWQRRRFCCETTTMMKRSRVCRGTKRNTGNPRTKQRRRLPLCPFAGLVSVLCFVSTATRWDQTTDGAAVTLNTEPSEVSLRL